MIKEVANVYFEALAADNANGIQKGDIVLFLDSLKVSTIEQTAEEAFAQGGWGNPKLVSWNYGKEIKLTLQDALFSTESTRFMLGGAIKRSKEENQVKVSLTTTVTLGSDKKLGTKLTDAIDDTIEYDIPTNYKFINMTQGVRGQVGSQENLTEDEKKYILADWNAVIAAHSEFASGDKVRIFWTEEVTEEDAAVEITISPNTFPGTLKQNGSAPCGELKRIANQIGELLEAV